MGLPQENTEKKRGNPNWTSGKSANPAGRPRTLNPEKKNNKQLRNEAMLKLVRRFYPHLTKAIQAAVDVLDNKQASEAGKLRASAFIVETYRTLLKDVYDWRYDDDEAEEIQQKNAPVFSLKMIGGKEEDKQE